VAFLFQHLADYLLAASEAGAAGAAASEAGAEAASTGAGAGAAGAAAGASFLPQATRAAAAKRVANRSDFFMTNFPYRDEKQFPEIAATCVATKLSDARPSAQPVIIG
jgi:hypothetical protein